MEYQHLTRKQEEEIKDFMLQSKSVKDWNERRERSITGLEMIFGDRRGKVKIRGEWFTISMYLQFVYKLIDGSGLIKKCKFI